MKKITSPDNYGFLLLKVYRQINCKNKSNVLWITWKIRDKVEIDDKPVWTGISLGTYFNWYISRYILQLYNDDGGQQCGAYSCSSQLPSQNCRNTCHAYVGK